MENIQLEGMTFEPHYGKNIDEAPTLLARWNKGECYIPSEADIRLLGVRNFQNAPQIAKNYWDTSTLSATKGDIIKVILAYDNSESHQLTDVARFALSLINPDERLVDGGINLDVDDRWEKLKGSGVYTLEREDLVLNRALSEEEALEHKLLLTRLVHPEYVDAEFSRSADEVVEIIGKTFELGKRHHGYDTMMGQYLPDVSDKGVLRAWYVLRLDYGSNANGRYDLDYGGGRFVGIAPEARSAPGKGVPNIKAYTMADIQAVDKAMKGLEGILHPDVLKPFAELRKKL